MQNGAGGVHAVVSQVLGLPPAREVLRHRVSVPAYVDGLLLVAVRARHRIYRGSSKPVHTKSGNCCLALVLSLLAGPAVA